MLHFYEIPGKIPAIKPFRISLSSTLRVKNDDCCRVPRYPIEVFSEFKSSVVPPDSQIRDALWFVYSEHRLLVKDVAYFGSQPWPFPDSPMIGFTAQYASGEIRIDGEEIAEAGWHRWDQLPEIPGQLSIARQLIDWFVKKHSYTGGKSRWNCSPSGF